MVAIYPLVPPISPITHTSLKHVRMLMWNDVFSDRHATRSMPHTSPSTTRPSLLLILDVKLEWIFQTLSIMLLFEKKKAQHFVSEKLGQVSFNANSPEAERKQCVPWVHRRLLSHTCSYIMPKVRKVDFFFKVCHSPQIKKSFKKEWRGGKAVVHP